MTRTLVSFPLATRGGNGSILSSTTRAFGGKAWFCNVGGRHHPRAWRRNVPSKVHP